MPHWRQLGASRMFLLMPALLEFGAVLGNRYRIERELGQGGMATVYLAHDLKHDRAVALKVLRAELAAVLGVERFLHEIRTTANLQHPHILPLHDSGDAGGLLYYVMPYVAGESLRAHLTRESQLGLEEALSITRQMAQALDYAHRQGVIHRDIKPENILLHEGNAMLSDFGIALAVKAAGGNRLTETGLSLGTPQYMSPEQATGDRTLDARSDVYSLAAVLYEMLAGEPPVTGPNAQAMIAKLMTERPTRLRVVRDTVPEGIDAAVAKALSKVPADRFPSASEFARRLVLPDARAAEPAPIRRRWRTYVMVGIITLTLATAAGIALRPRARIVSTFTPQPEQLTTDGNARSPAVSPDGSRLAYVARDCDQQERCTDRLVVRDIGAAGSITVLTSSRIGGASWISNGRFLIAGVEEPDGRRSTIVVSALGGASWSLPGWGIGVMGTSDTVLLGPGFRRSGDTVGWMRIATVSDRLVRDSIAIRFPAIFQVGFPAPVGGGIALFSRTVSGPVIRLMDRSGRVTDSLRPSNSLSGAVWTPQGDAMLLQEELGGVRPPYVHQADASAPTVIVRWRVTNTGTFGTSDTLWNLPPGSQITMVLPDGSLLLSQGPVETVVYAVERPRLGQLDFSSRRLVSSTASLEAQLSRDGATVWLKRGGAGPGSPRRDAFIPFDGGTERPFNYPAGNEIFADWTRPVSSGFLAAVRDSSGRAWLIEVDVATGRSRSVADLPPRTAWIFSIPGGGYGAVDESYVARVAGRPGRADTTWTVPAQADRLLNAPADVTSDGRAFIEFSQSSDFATMWVRRVPIDGGMASQPVGVSANYWLGTFVDGSLEWVLGEPTGGLGWYRVPPGGSRSVRLGDAPIQGEGTTWTVSDDGRRFIVVKSMTRPDVVLIRNFGELLKR